MLIWLSTCVPGVWSGSFKYFHIRFGLNMHQVNAGGGRIGWIDCSAACRQWHQSVPASGIRSASASWCTIKLIRIHFVGCLAVGSGVHLAAGFSSSFQLTLQIHLERYRRAVWIYIHGLPEAGVPGPRLIRTKRQQINKYGNIAPARQLMRC